MLYFDESGYTGPDLTNSKQPYFSLASIRMTDEEIAQIKKEVGYCEWGRELHFKVCIKVIMVRKYWIRYLITLCWTIITYFHRLRINDTVSMLIL